jgi:hypothetical protein
VGTTLVPLDLPEVWALSDRPIRHIAFNLLLSRNVSDHKRERQTPGLRVLRYSMVRSFPKFVNLSPYDLGNEAPETSVERVEGTEKHVPPLCLVSQRTHVPVKHNVYKPQIWRNLRLTCCVPVFICILPLTHVGDNVLDGEHGGAVDPRYIQLRKLMTVLQNSRYVGYGHLHIYIVNGREKNVWLAALVPQMLIKGLNQTLVCSGGDGLEQPLQTPALQFLVRPTCSIILGEFIFDGERSLQDELSALNRWSGNNGVGPE